MKTIDLNLGLSVMVDDEDYEFLSQFNWFAKKDHNTHYAQRNQLANDEDDLSVGMHRIIMKAPKHLQVDHIDRNGLNNQKSNLRLVSNAQNAQNTRAHIDSKSGIRGVSWESSRRKWSVTITVDYKTIRVGRYQNIEEAIAARDAASRLYHPFNADNYGA